MKIPYFIIIMFLCPLALVGQEINYYQSRGK